MIKLSQKAKHFEAVNYLKKDCQYFIQIYFLIS